MPAFWRDRFAVLFLAAPPSARTPNMKLPSGRLVIVAAGVLVTVLSTVVLWVVLWTMALSMGIL